MTKEIALHCMKSASELERELCEECPIYGQTGCDHCFEDALQYVVGMLEQEPVLEQIRAEIEQTADEEQKHDEKWAIGLRYAIKIIDKYKAENEEMLAKAENEEMLARICGVADAWQQI